MRVANFNYFQSIFVHKTLKAKASNQKKICEKKSQGNNLKVFAHLISKEDSVSGSMSEYCEDDIYTLKPSFHFTFCETGPLAQLLKKT